MSCLNFLTYKKVLSKSGCLPFYVYDFNLIQGQILNLQKILPQNCKICYVTKTNPNLAILRIMKNFNLSCAVLSLGELAAAEKAGLASQDIIFMGSTKADYEFFGALRKNVSLFSIESLSELVRLNKIAKLTMKKAEIFLRINCRDIFENRRLGGQFIFSEFGLCREEIAGIARDFSAKFPNLALKGIHFYTGGRIYEAHKAIELIKQGLSVMKKLENDFKINFESISIGGGFGSSTTKEFDAIDFGGKLKRLLKEYHCEDKKIILELGRYLVNRSGAYVTRVLEVKKINKYYHFIVEGVINHLNRFITPESSRENPEDYEVRILSPHRRTGNDIAVIRGQVSTTIDAFGRKLNSFFSLPLAREGDFVVIYGVGGYGLTWAWSLLGSRNFSAEFLQIDGKLELIRETGTINDLFRHQKVPKILKN